MPKTVTATEANQNFSRLLRDAAAGETVVITQRGKPVVAMSPAAADADLERQTAAFEAALAHYRTLDRMMLRGWTRDSLYDRDPWTRPE